MALIDQSYGSQRRARMPPRECGPDSGLAKEVVRDR
jgi:hypothetical protein